MSKIGYCRYCRKSDAEVYDQKAEVHNAECKSCWGLYEAIVDYPGREKGNCRDALRAAVQELKLVASIEGNSAILDETDLPPNYRSAIARIREKLASHASRVGGSTEKALKLILREVSHPK